MPFGESRNRKQNQAVPVVPERKPGLGSDDSLVSSRRTAKLATYQFISPLDKGGLRGGIAAGSLTKPSWPRGFRPENPPSPSFSNGKEAEEPLLAKTDRW